ncbi:MAG: hypothetical protein HQ456_05435 [Polynucleobacter sp.]|nr:hypothetical protein [Polynucleobacter sp.]
MNLRTRLLRLEKKCIKPSSGEFVFRGNDETVDEAYGRGKLLHPNVDLIVVVSWIRPLEHSEH